jgi:CheY-like chemotaxis protein
VLIVDDHAVIRRMLHDIFEAHDLEVCEAENGADGVQKAQELNPCLVILDLSMPVMTSAGIFAVISKSGANSSQQLVARAKSLLGLDGHILKYGS